MADIEFIGQPFNSKTIGGALVAALADDEARRFRCAVAWGKASGLTRIGRAIANMRDRRTENSAVMYVGIDEGGATWEGLKLVQTVCSQAYVFHDAGARTYHPKVYVVEGERSATVLVGSGNSTRGGLFTNYEGADCVHLDLDRTNDVSYLASVNSFLDGLHALTSSCLLLDDDLMEKMRDGNYRIQSEAAANRQRRANSNGRHQGSAVFGSVAGLAGAPQPTLAPVEADEADEDATAPTVPAAATEATSSQPAAVSSTSFGRSGHRGFYKRLSEHDASRDQAPGQIVIPKRFEPFFPPLTLQWDQIASGGSRQSEVKFPARFKDGSYTKDLAEVRVIRYEPKPSHKRKNIELRFTFHDHEVVRRFRAGDVIEFGFDDGRCHITRRALRRGESGYDWLS